VENTASDRTICKFDYFFRALKTASLFTAYSYFLFDSTGKAVLCTGLYIIVDGGYARWRCLQSGNKNPLDTSDAWYSRGISASRKDIECKWCLSVTPITDPSIQTFDDVGVFGRLKRRWRWMLNGRIELRTRVDIDNAVFTYVAIYDRQMPRLLKLWQVCDYSQPPHVVGWKVRGARRRGGILRPRPLITPVLRRGRCTTITSGALEVPTDNTPKK